ncbi:phytoene/squalene synthase family protein [Methylophilaceae bacterium]|nr:phytoene/squalene synthase family protein [Methylophilaceae bacterium]
MKNYSNVMRKHGKTFFWATWFLEKEIASLLYAVYAFCRRLDDLVDKKGNKKNLKKVFSLPDIWKKNEYHKAFNEFEGFKSKALPREIIVKEFLKGQVGDLNYKQPKNIDQLLVYCYQVAGSVGLMVCDVIGIKNKELKYYAIDLGIAMQLTNICRDIMEDAKMGRIYLPKNMVNNLSIEKFKKPSDNDKRIINSARNNLLKDADEYYKSAMNGISHLPSKTSRAVIVAAKLYQAIGESIIKNKISYQAPRVYISKLHKIAITFKALFQLKKHFYIKLHDQHLHQSLLKLPDTHLK